MKLKVYVVDFETPRWVRRVVAYVAPAVLVLGVAAIALAGNLVTWTDGQPLKSADLNNNFTYLEGQITALQTAQAAAQAVLTQATADGGYSLGATFCGATAATAGSFSGPGTLTGYASAKASCQAVPGCSSTGAHMCAPDEIVRTRQRGIPVTATAADNDGWMAGGTYNYYSPGASSTTDCNGWTSSSGSSLGPSWVLNAGANAPTIDWCNNAQPILCCN